jgi:hypothetical protein
VRFYKIDELKRQNSEYCAVRTVPEGTNSISHRYRRGIYMADEYPDDARINMSNRHPGKVLCDFLSNTKSILFVSRKMKEIVESMADNEIEYLPFSLYNHKGRLASSDYFIINIIVGIDTFVLDAEKVKEAPHIFRIKEDPCEYVVSETLANAFKAANLTNINLEELEVK